MLELSEYNFKVAIKKYFNEQLWSVLNQSKNTKSQQSNRKAQKRKGT